MSNPNFIDNSGIGVVSIKSSWQAEKETKNAQNQTMALGLLESEAQTEMSALNTTEQIDKGEGIDARTLVPSAEMANSGWVYPGDHHDDASVAAFLQEIQKPLINELLANCKSNAFDSYEPNWKEKNTNSIKLSTFIPAMALETEWHAVQLSWNATGSQLAVAYGRVDTVAFCHNKGIACVWQVNQEDETKPLATFEADSFITSIAFHPKKPGLLAGGTYSGEILLWNLAEPAAKPHSSINYVQGPREPISRLQWLVNVREQRDSHRYVLCSGSADGKILFWTPVNDLKEAVSGYEVQNKKHALVGVQSLGFVNNIDSSIGSKISVPGIENVMLLGLESGEVFRTKPGNATSAGAGSTTGAFTVLEIEHFQGHLGPVQSVDCSPFFRNLFLTASADGAIRLYSTLERQHLISLEPSQETRHFLYEARFSPSRPSVLAAVSRSGHLHFYDLARSRTAPASSEASGLDGAPVYSVAFNPVDHSLIATGDGKGAVRIWRLSSQLSEPTDIERQAIRFDQKSTNSQDFNPIRSLFGFTF